jgi:hypothetical protein
MIRSAPPGGIGSKQCLYVFGSKSGLSVARSRLAGAPLARLIKPGPMITATVDSILPTYRDYIEPTHTPMGHSQREVCRELGVSLPWRGPLATGFDTQQPKVEGIRRSL